MNACVRAVKREPDKVTAEVQLRSLPTIEISIGRIPDPDAVGVPSCRVYLVFVLRRISSMVGMEFIRV